MKFKYYFRKSSFKKDIDSANILLEQIEIHKPQNFLEVGVFQGVTSKNVCEKLYEINKENFLFHGIDVFENTDSNFDSREKTTKHNRLSTPTTKSNPCNGAIVHFQIQIMIGSYNWYQPKFHIALSV